MTGMPISFKFYGITALMFLSAFISVLLQPHAKLSDQQPKIDLEHMVPQKFMDWRIEDSVVPVVPSPDLKLLIDKLYDQTLMRSYINGRRERVMLTISYGSSQSQDLKAHRQEVCYRSQGFEILNLRRNLIKIMDKPVSVTQMLASKPDRTETVIYWFTMGSNVVMSPLERLVVQLKYALSGVIPDGFLVRVSLLGPDNQETFDLQMRFINDLVRNIDVNLRDRLIGNVIN